MVIEPIDASKACVESEYQFAGNDEQENESKELQWRGIDTIFEVVLKSANIWDSYVGRKEKEFFHHAVVNSRSQKDMIHRNTSSQKFASLALDNERANESRDTENGSPLQ